MKQKSETFPRFLFCSEFQQDDKKNLIGALRNEKKTGLKPVLCQNETSPEPQVDATRGENLIKL